jgi:hypothetical protein
VRRIRLTVAGASRIADRVTTRHYLPPPFPRQGNSAPALGSRLFVRRRLPPADDALAIAQWKDGGGFSVDTLRELDRLAAQVRAALLETGQERRMDDETRLAALSRRSHDAKKSVLQPAHTSPMPGSVSPRW